MSRLTTFINGLRSMRPMLEVRPYWWGLGPVFHFNEPTKGDSWWAMHFSEMGLVIGPLWVGIKDND